MKIKITHPAPGRRGKQEVRTFADVADAAAYVERNTRPREHGRAPRIAGGAPVDAAKIEKAIDQAAKGARHGRR